MLSAPPADTHAVEAFTCNIPHLHTLRSSCGDLKPGAQPILQWWPTNSMSIHHSSSCVQNNDYESAGAKLVDTAAALGSDIVLKVRPPSIDAEVPMLKPGGNLISYIQPAVNKDLVTQLGEKKMNVIGAARP